MLWAQSASAHVSEQGFVLLLPTGVYITAGVAVVALTVLALVMTPPGTLARFFAQRPLPAVGGGVLANVTSVASFLVLLALIVLGHVGPRDPLSNLMPLGFWALGWVGLVSLSGVFGSPWHWINPWTGLYAFLGRPQLLRLPAGLGCWPAIVLLLGFGAFLLADIAPDDPARLARIVGVYWAATFAGACLFGPAWFRQAELGQVILSVYGRMAVLRLRAPAGIGAPGWQLASLPSQAGLGVFALVLLGAGSFDGLNETFWWLGQIGVNPLEFPGRSAVVLQTIGGLVTAIAALLAFFAVSVWLGLRLAGRDVPFARAFGLLALGVLPIALVYHVAHYLTSFLVSIQYAVAAISDPLARGSDWLSLGDFRVTTGFFNRLDTVRLIWLSQAGLVVLGHVWSVLLTHRLAMSLLPEPEKATRLTLPLSLFMIAYTFLGLWLLAAPRGA